MSLKESLESENVFSKYVKTAKDMVDQAFRKIVKFQKGEEKLIKTPYEHLNENMLGGLLPNDVVTICGISGSGKTYQSQKIIDGILDKNLNPDCDDYLIIRFNWEMSIFKILLRKLSRKLKKKMSEILMTEIKEEDRYKWERIRKEETSQNILYVEDPLTPDEFYMVCNAILSQYNEEKQQKKKRFIFEIDHIALVRGSDKKKSIDSVVESINILRKKYENTIWIILSQLNRDIEARKKASEHAPTRSDVYQSDSIFHLSDVVLCVHNPKRLFLKTYMSFPKEAYEWLDKYKTSARVSFEVDGLIFLHYLKIREMDLESGKEIKDLFVEELPWVGDKYQKKHIFDDPYRKEEENIRESDEVPF